jgi:hypothetical protein
VERALHAVELRQSPLERRVVNDHHVFRPGLIRSILSPLAPQRIGH